ncbi:hypothetical protein Tco_0353369 [Tanacetum coccineum]
MVSPALVSAAIGSVMSPSVTNSCFIPMAVGGFDGFVLFGIYKKMGFGIKWRSWISGCLHNARSSILVNGSPTKEFELFRGLRQGDPLSSFLCILAIERATLPHISASFSRGRLSLIKAVLGNLPTYFMSIYLMAVSIRSKLESMRSKFFRGVDLNENKMSWVKWERCLASKKKGGLDIGSIYGLNTGLLFKWIWRQQNKQTTWGSILSLINRLKEKGIDLLSFCTRKLGNGESTRFWEDIWFGSTPLRLQLPRIYILDTDRNCPIANRIPLLHSDWSTVLMRSPRGGVELAQFDDLNSSIGNVLLTDQCDSW